MLNFFFGLAEEVLAHHGLVASIVEQRLRLNRVRTEWPSTLENFKIGLEFRELVSGLIDGRPILIVVDRVAKRGICYDVVSGKFVMVG